MYVHFRELWSSHFSEERFQNPMPRERLACLEPCTGGEREQSGGRNRVRRKNQLITTWLVCL